MAGTDARFNAGQFRDAIRFAMQMGAPNKTQDKATFLFKKTRTWPPGTRLDQEGRPFDPTVTPVLTGKDPVVLDNVAVEFAPARPEEVEVGNFRPTKVELTLLDEDWELVKDAIEVSLEGGDRYAISYEKPVNGLFEVDVHTFVAFARDES